MTTLQQFVSALQAVLNERGPEFVYSTNEPRYSNDDGETGSDLFGAALIEKLGIEYQEGWEGTSISMLIDKGWIPIEEELEAEQLLVFSSMQDHEDEGYPYEEVDNFLNHAVATGKMPRPRPEDYAPSSVHSDVPAIDAVPDGFEVIRDRPTPPLTYSFGNIREPWADGMGFGEHDHRL